MTVRIPCKDRKEAENIRHAMSLPDVRAFVITMGVLDQLPTDRARQRVMNFVVDKFSDDADCHTVLESAASCTPKGVADETLAG